MGNYFQLVSKTGRFLQLCSLFSIIVLNISCSPSNNTLSGSTPDPVSDAITVFSDCNRTSPVVVGPTEKAYCSNIQIYSGVTVTGTAQYQPRIISEGGAGLLGPDTEQPIRFAEIEVLNEAGTTIQCGTTTGTGSFTLDLPSSTAAHKILVRSRGDNSSIKASVMKCPEENVPYEMSSSFIPDSSKAIGNILATTDGEILGGAFNIFNQLVKANEYLATKAGGCTTPYTNCTDFLASTYKIEVFWETGFNPGAYSGSTSGTSFYIPDSGRLFILGGINGDVNSTDTDHFDNSVILHEYAHFLEDKFSISDSPGGQHSGNGLIDPRLAWSEGFANFFQAAVLGSSFYTDTTGNIDGATSSFTVDLENQTSASAGVYALDVPANRTGEGNFREFSVTRLLMDTEDTDNDAGFNDAISDRFKEVWAAITGTDGFKYAPNKYRSIGLLHLNRDVITGNSDWSPLVDNEKHQANRDNYAKYLQADVSCNGTLFTMDPLHISGKDNLSLDHGFNTSHLLVNNDFYHYNHPGGNFNIKLSYSTASLPEADLDLFIYKETARLGNYDDMVNTIAANEGVAEPDQSLATTQQEVVQENSLPAGEYLINVFNYTGTGSTSTTTYDLIVTIDGTGDRTLCSGTL